MDEEIELMLEMKKGGQWLGAARRWMQSNIPSGDSLTWGSSELVQVPFGSLEEMARRKRAPNAPLEATAGNEDEETRK